MAATLSMLMVALEFDILLLCSPLHGSLMLLQSVRPRFIPTRSSFTLPLCRIIKFKLTFTCYLNTDTVVVYNLFFWPRLLST
jgi:hypothetical protein